MQLCVARVKCFAFMLCSISDREASVKRGTDIVDAAYDVNVMNVLWS